MFTTEQIKSLNELEMEVYRYVMNHRNTIPYMRIRELAAESHVSTTTVLRFCKKLDCEGFTEFKYKMKELIGQDKEVFLSNDQQEIDNFFTEHLSSPHFQEQLEAASASIAKADKILLFGIGNSIHIAGYAARCFTNVGKFSLCITDPFYPTRLVPSISSLVIILSVSGESQQILEFARDLNNINCPFISITASSNCTLYKMAELGLVTGVHAQRSNSLDYTTQIPAVYILETLARKVGNRLTE